MVHQSQTFPMAEDGTRSPYQGTFRARQHERHAPWGLVAGLPSTLFLNAGLIWQLCELAKEYKLLSASYTHMSPATFHISLLLASKQANLGRPWWSTTHIKIHVCVCHHFNCHFPGKHWLPVTSFDFPDKGFWNFTDRTPFLARTNEHIWLYRFCIHYDSWWGTGHHSLSYQLSNASTQLVVNYMQNCGKTQNPTIYFESHCYAALAAREIKKSLL